MSRNRMKNSHTLQWASVVKWVMIVGFLSVLGLCYVLVKNQIVSIAADVGKQEKQLRLVVERNRQLSLDIARLKAPQRLDRYVAAVNARLPGGQQFIRITEERLVRLDRTGNDLRVARAGRGTLGN